MIEGAGAAVGRGVRPIGRDVLAIALVKAAAAALALLLGFRAVSDDDFARVVIAEEWAAAPKLDPSGTSWLPLPFWITGIAMQALGRSLSVARGASIALGILSAMLVYVAARWITDDRRVAFVGSIVAAVFPWSARLGVAMVPELPAAALALLAVASLSPPRDQKQPVAGRMVIGGAALAASALSRYEAWPIAALIAAVAAYYVIRGAYSPAGRGKLVLAAALAIAAPAAWIAWNKLAHGDALHFLERVAAYRRALGGGGGSAFRAIYLYPMALVRHEPELVGSLLIMAAFARRPGVPGVTPIELRDHLRRYARPAVVLLAQITLLSAAMVKDGAPTHHPERALLSAMLLLAVVAGDLGLALFSSAALRRRLALSLAVFLVPTALLLRKAIRMEDYAERGDEMAIGAAAAAQIPPGDRVLLEVADYGYFAVIAAFARPEDVIIDRSIDPRDGPLPSSFGDREALSKRLQESGARHFIVRLSSPVAPTRATLTRGAWGLFGASALAAPPALTRETAP